MFSETHFVVGATFLSGLILLVIYHLRRLRLYKKASKFCGPPTLPFVGNACQFFGNTEDIFNKCIELSRVYPSPYRFWLGPQSLIFLSGPEEVKVIRSSLNIWAIEHYYAIYMLHGPLNLRFYGARRRSRSRNYMIFFNLGWEKACLRHPVSFTSIHNSCIFYLRIIEASCLLFFSEKIWRVHRKLIGPTFNLKILESFVAVFAAQSNVMVKKMEAELNGAEFPVFDYVSKCTLDIICETTMGVSMRAQIKNDCSYVEAAEKTFAIVYQRMFKVWLHPSAIFNRTQLGTEQNKHINTMHNFTNNVIQRKKKSLLNKTAVSGEDNEDKQNGRNHGSSGGLFFPYVFLLHGVSPVVFNI
ncbi:cytochrome P450 4C1-like isoform X1 [Neodiprion pinetum]|uniref:Cytochrome P450 4c3-like isoform X1 n=1 Tax=Neodiprion lecontei TaxID=441921 RepID=A0ABM3FU75_NEOLC|nr:cytochrome P450 4c3-like isoform X1 [Neodiprion lecontei]